MWRRLLRRVAKAACARVAAIFFDLRVALIGAVPLAKLRELKVRLEVAQCVMAVCIHADGPCPCWGCIHAENLVYLWALNMRHTDRVSKLSL